MELGPRDRLSQAFMKELEKGRTIDTPYGPVVHLDLRHLGEKKINAKIPFVRELCMKYQNLDPVTDLIPVRPVVHYMMGGVHTDINGATPLPGCTPPARRRASASTAPTGSGRTRCRSCWCSARARAARRPSTPRASRTSNPRVMAQATDEQRRIEHDLLNKKGRERIADLRDDMQKTMEESAGIYRSGESLREGVQQLAPPAGAIRRRRHRGSQPDLQHRARSRPWSCRSCSTSPRRSSTRRCGAKNRAARTSAPIFPARDDQRFLAHSLIYRQRRRLVPGRVPAGHDHPLAAGRAGLWGGRTAWRTASRCRSRGTVRRQESEITFDEYEVPCPKEWVVLDGLNHVKDRLDGTLAYRWSCRMGICGSCGMTVNGEPKLTCATFLADYAPGPGPRRAAPQLSRSSATSSSTSAISCASWCGSSPGSCASTEKPLVGGRVPADPAGAGRVQAVQHVHQLHAVLCGVPDLRP